MRTSRQQVSLKKDASLGYTGGVVAVLAVIMTILIGKAYFVDSEYVFLYGYGVCVTLVLFVTFYTALRMYEDPAVSARIILDKKGASDEAQPFFSCIVAAWNEEDFMTQCIDSLLAQDYKEKEIIIVNDGSTDNTGKILDQYAKKGLIKVLHQKNGGKKGALANGVKIARGDIIAFSDSDSIWAPDVLTQMSYIFRAYPDVGGVSGHGRAHNAQKNILTKAQDAWYEGQFAIRKAFESHYGVVTCVSGPLAVFRRSAIYNFLPAWVYDTFLGQEFRFATDRTLTGFVLGSQYIGQKLKDRFADDPFVKDHDYPIQKWRIVYSKSARSETIVPDTMKRVLKQHVRWKKSFIRNIFFTGRFYWHNPFWPVVVYYARIIFVLVGPIIAFRHIIYLPLNGSVLSAVFYLSGIAFIGLIFGAAYRLENKDCHYWMYRPVMSILSTLVLSWLIFYSILHIRTMEWDRD